MKRGGGVLLVLGAGALLRLPLLGSAPLWADEIHTLEAVGRPVGEMLGERLAAGHLPLYFLLLKGWCALFGTSAVALRLPSALLGIALLVPARAFFFRLSGRPALATGAAFLLAVSPLFTGLAREARMYPLLGFLFLVLAESSLAAAADGRIRVRMVLAAALGPLVHATWLPAVLALAAFLWIRREGPPRVRWTVAGAAALAALAFLLFAGGTPQPDLERRPFLREIGVFVLRLVAGEGIRERHLIPAAALLLVATAAAVVGWRRAAGRERLFATLLFLFPIAGSVGAGLAFGAPYGPVRYVFLSVVPVALLVARGLSREIQ